MMPRFTRKSMCIYHEIIFYTIAEAKLGMPLMGHVSKSILTKIAGYFVYFSVETKEFMSCPREKIMDQ